MDFRTELTTLPEVKILFPNIRTDERGSLTEIYRADLALGERPFVVTQINHSHSKNNVLRGLHLQSDPPLRKVVRVIGGEAFMVVVDMRIGSGQCGKWFGRTFTSKERELLYVPEGFAVGFCVMEEFADVEYLYDARYSPQGESAIRWDDAEIGITWPINKPILSPRDQTAPLFRDWLSQYHSRTAAVRDSA